jgi:hypothetical protein
MAMFMEVLEDRTLPAGTPGLSSGWFALHLRDTALNSLATADFQRDGELSRQDVLGLFHQAAADGKVTARELRDLRTLLKNGPTLGMTPDVVELGDKVVGFDRANRWFQGRPLLAFGRLSAGAKGQVLNNLVAKWFLGQDHPTLTKGAVAAGCTYQNAQGVLFAANGPSIQDIDQGILGDCFLPAALGAITAHDPAAIHDMFIDNGDGTFAVRFYRKVHGHEVADWITVDRALPVDSTGHLIYAGYGQSASDPNEVLWLALAEKAYAQLAASGWDHAAKKVNSYATLDEGGFAVDVLQQALGEPARSFDLTSENVFNAAVTSGDFITLDSKLHEAKASPVLEDHAYFVTAYNAGMNTYTIVNPWGPNFDDGAGHPGTLQLTWRQIVKAFDSWDDAAAPIQPARKGN